MYSTIVHVVHGLLVPDSMNSQEPNGTKFESCFSLILVLMNIFIFFLFLMYFLNLECHNVIIFDWTFHNNFIFFLFLMYFLNLEHHNVNIFDWTFHIIDFYFVPIFHWTFHMFYFDFFPTFDVLFKSSVIMSLYMIEHSTCLIDLWSIHQKLYFQS